MKTIYFFVQGQFGNNLFQYFAGEILKKIYPVYDEVKPTYHINLEFNNVIDDGKFKEIITKHINGEKYELDTSRDILLMGFFQRSEIFKFEYDYLRKLFNIDNTNNISNRIKIGNIVKYQTKHTIIPSELDLTMHIHCNEFWDKEKNTSQMYHPDFLKNIIKSIKYDKLYIVCNKPENDWEHNYYKQFDELSPVWINGNLGDDFDFLMKSKTLITSASPLAWIAAFLGEGNTIHIPYNIYYGGFESSNQSLAEFNDDKCKMYYNVDYWIPTMNIE